MTPREKLKEEVEEAQKGMARSEIPKGLVLVEGVWQRGDTVWVPDSQRETVLKEYHDSVLSGHPGNWKTIKLIRREY